jgi:hypothetical protein
MSELFLPKNTLIKLDEQPEFPRTDLNENNTEMLKHVLHSHEGLIAQGNHLRPYQGYIHMIADFALKASGIKTRYAEDELQAFSQGFATFETIHIAVHPPQVYDIAIARKKVQKIFMPPALDPLDIELAEMTGTPGPVFPEGTVFSPELELAERHGRWTTQLPNTFDVIVSLGERQRETMEQIHARTAGAHIAYQLATEDLDAA